MSDVDGLDTPWQDLLDLAKVRGYTGPALEAYVWGVADMVGDWGVDYARERLGVNLETDWWSPHFAQAMLRALAGDTVPQTGGKSMSRRRKQEVLCVSRLSVEEQRDLAASDPALLNAEAALLVSGPRATVTAMEALLRSVTPEENLHTVKDAMGKAAVPVGMEGASADMSSETEASQVTLDVRELDRLSRAHHAAETALWALEAGVPLEEVAGLMGVAPEQLIASLRYDAPEGIDDVRGELGRRAADAWNKRERDRLGQPPRNEG